MRRRGHVDVDVRLSAGLPRPKAERQEGALFLLQGKRMSVKNGTFARTGGYGVQLVH